MENLKKGLDEALNDAFKNLKKYEPGTKEHASAMVDIKELSRARTTIQKDENEAFNKDKELSMAAQKYCEGREDELEKVKEELKSEKKKFWLGVATTAATVGAYLYMGVRTTKFEDVGCVTSKAFPKFPNLFTRH